MYKPLLARQQCLVKYFNHLAMNVLLFIRGRIKERVHGYPDRGVKQFLDHML